MSREIKFRGKRTDNDEWIIGCLYYDQTGYYIKVSHHSGRFGCGCPVIPETVGEFIGMKDKNGKEIFEGDIGEIRTQSGRIERFTVDWGIHRRDMKSGWTVDIPGFCFRVDGNPTFPIANNYLNGHDLDIITIIGNIYENPELLTQPPLA